MRFVIQRVKHASVTVNNEIVGKIGPGLMILVGLTEGDTDEFIDHVTDKFLNLRLWDDSKGTRWKECVKSLNYEILLVSQFTLYSYMKGNKPDYHFAMNGDNANVLFDKIVELTRKKYDPNKIQTGKFGAYMQVELCNDGPVTIQWEYPGDVAEKIEQNNKKKNNNNNNKKENNGMKYENKEKKKEAKVERRKERKGQKNEEEKKEEEKKEEKKKEEEKKEEKKEEKEEEKEDEKEINEIDTTKKAE